jgi:hypothetical protein
MLKLNRIGVFKEDTLSYVGIIRIRFMGIISACNLFKETTQAPLSIRLQRKRKSANNTKYLLICTSDHSKVSPL